MLPNLVGTLNILNITFCYSISWWNPDPDPDHDPDSDPEKKILKNVCGEEI